MPHLVHVRTLFFFFFPLFLLPSSSRRLLSLLFRLLSSLFSVFFVAPCAVALVLCLVCVSVCVGRGGDRVCAQKRLRVYVQNVPVCTCTTRTYVSTCARGAGTHGDVLTQHTEVFSVPHHAAHTHAPHAHIHTTTTTTVTARTTHTTDTTTDTTCTPTHNITHNTTRNIWRHNTPHTRGSWLLLPLTRACFEPP